nr:lymphocyte antigen 6 complex locus protein G6d [Neomonachus schauinslandi]
MNSLLVGVLLGTLLGSALGKEAAKACPPLPTGSRSAQVKCLFSPARKRKGGPSSSCKETVATCGEGECCGFLELKPQPGRGQNKLCGNPSVTLIHHYPACVAAHHCNQVETELVGDVTYTTHRDCCVGDLCNSAVASTVAPPCILAAAATTLAWLLPALWRG